MGFSLSSILGSNLGALVKDVVGTFKMDPAKKAELEAAVDANSHELALKQLKLEERAQDAITAEVNAKKDIIVAELQQSDNYTKRARPTIIYFGLLAIFLIHVVLPIAAYMIRNAVPAIALPEEFWWTWGTICSTYSIGRSTEKMGYQKLGRVLQAPASLGGTLKGLLK